ncbi:unnamed protein product [Withania somnifera]
MASFSFRITTSVFVLLFLGFTSNVFNNLAAYIGLQTWKRVIYSDPNNRTSNWVGPSVCNYTGFYCVSFPNDTKVQAVAGIDLNHADIAGFLPEELGLLNDLALLHLNSNRFCGVLPLSLSNLTLLYELDLSNNRFVGPFPSVVLSLPSLNYLEIRFNDKNLDASSASVVVFANNYFGGCLPPRIANFANTLEELLLTNTSLSGCLPPEVGFLYKLKVLDVSNNKLAGPIPYTIASLADLELINLAHNMFSGIVPEGICLLPKLSNFTLSYNYFCEEQRICSMLTSKGPLQRSKKECDALAEHPIDSLAFHCGT